MWMKEGPAHAGGMTSGWRSQHTGHHPRILPRQREFWGDRPLSLEAGLADTNGSWRHYIKVVPGDTGMAGCVPTGDAIVFQQRSMKSSCTPGLFTHFARRPFLVDPENLSRPTGIFLNR